MVLRFKKKVRKMRGSHTHGWGHKKKHRGGGSRGGRGFSGMHKHKYSYVVAKDPDRYGYKGFVVPHKKKVNVINVGELEKLAGPQYEINLTQLGFSKLLSKGNVTKPLRVTVKKYTEKAKEKITAAGGTVIAEESSVVDSKEAN